MTLFLWSLNWFAPSSFHPQEHSSNGTASSQRETGIVHIRSKTTVAVVSVVLGLIISECFLLIASFSIFNGAGKNKTQFSFSPHRNPFHIF